MTGLTDAVRHGDALPEVHVRACDQHNIPLDERGDRLWCSWRRGHYTETWKVVDIRSSRAIARVQQDGGRREPSAIEDLKERAMPMPTAAAAPKAVHEKRALDRVKYVAAGEVLWLRAVCHPTKYGGDAFRVTWAEVMPLPGKKTGKGERTAWGIVATCPDAASCRKRFSEAREDAARLGWKESEICGGRKPIVFRPIPKPGSLRGLPKGGSTP